MPGVCHSSVKEGSQLCVDLDILVSPQVFWPKVEKVALKPLSKPFIYSSRYVRFGSIADMSAFGQKRSLGLPFLDYHFPY